MTFELIQIQMPPFSTTVINGNSNAAVVVAGFYINQLPAFPLPALRSTLRNILDAAVILFYFFTNSVFPYKTPDFYPENVHVYKTHNFIRIMSTYAKRTILYGGFIR